MKINAGSATFSGCIPDWTRASQGHLQIVCDEVHSSDTLTP
jgi:FrmR/RcnR family transcriptional regulator, repressor of frmRAB operon